MIGGGILPQKRHSREGGNPLAPVTPKNLDSRLRGSDGKAI